MSDTDNEPDIGYLGDSERIEGIRGSHVPGTERGGDGAAIDTSRGRFFNVGNKTFESADEQTNEGIIRRIKRLPSSLLSVGRKSA